MRRVQIPLTLLVLLLALVASACGSTNEASDTQTTAAPGTQSTAADPCAKDQLELVNDGTLTIGTDNPAYPPWFGGTPQGQWKISDPESGKGFESAVAYAVAEQLGFAKDEVEWTVVPFNNSFKPGPKDFDFDINQISFTPKRAQVVDFSDSYYDVNQSVVALNSSKIAGATSLADLKDAKLGAPVGTTSYDYITQNIQPSEEPQVYDTLDAGVAALKAKQIDGLVVDLPTAFFITAAQIEDSKIVGQFPTIGTQEHFGMVLQKDSPLTDCVNQALAALKADGTLDQIQQTWLSDKASAPVLQ
ncbi:MAG TPA: ABC transporter substrate-binding protein [Gaiellaceae bacterium]|nr:ABC transporter substrate-binding protein [Gaiellaceae bacterium]